MIRSAQCSDVNNPVPAHNPAPRPGLRPQPAPPSRSGTAHYLVSAHNLVPAPRAGLCPHPRPRPQDPHYPPPLTSSRAQSCTYLLKLELNWRRVHGRGPARLACPRPLQNPHKSHPFQLTAQDRKWTAETRPRPEAEGWGGAVVGVCCIVTLVVSSTWPPGRGRNGQRGSGLESRSREMRGPWVPGSVC
jgi:hypothetical protein